MTVALEATIVAHAIVESDLSAVTKRWVAKIVAEPCRLNQAQWRKILGGGLLRIFPLEMLSNASCNPCDLYRMRKARSIKVTFAKI
jgi:hypothetical protein